MGIKLQQSLNVSPVIFLYKFTIAQGRNATQNRNNS